MITVMSLDSVKFSSWSELYVLDVYFRKVNCVPTLVFFFIFVFFPTSLKKDGSNNRFLLRLVPSVNDKRKRNLWTFFVFNKQSKHHAVSPFNYYLNGNRLSPTCIFFWFNFSSFLIMRNFNYFKLELPMKVFERIATITWQFWED